MAKVSKPYDKLALIWDQMRQDRHSLRMIPYCQEIFKRFRSKPRTGLDLCCGTGSAIELLLEMGIDMDGLDGSAAMLTMASKKLRGRGVKLYHKQLPKFRIIDDHHPGRTRQYDLITSFYDSLNYLTTVRDLQAGFRSIADHLNPGGWFVFDMNTPAALKMIWDDQVWANALDDLAWVFRNEYVPRKKMAACHVTGFYRKGPNWQRFDETHWERGFENKQIKRLLTRAGLKIRGFYKCHTFRKPGPKTYRIAVAAQKSA
jgi:SAM-dependent methyltransferase